MGVEGAGIGNFNLFQNVQTGSELLSFLYSMRTVFLSRLYDGRGSKMWPPSADVKNKWSYILSLLVVFSFLFCEGWFVNW